MKKTYLTMIEADEGMVLVKDGTYSSSVLLRKGETSEGWSEITQEEYEAIVADQEDESIEDYEEVNAPEQIEE